MTERSSPWDKRREIAIPDSDQIIDCKDQIITAGFWNSHVHFTEDAWNNAAAAAADKLEQHMQEMLTRWGFTTVFDVGSFPQNTLALRRRVNRGERGGKQDCRWYPAAPGEPQIPRLRSG